MNTLWVCISAFCEIVHGTQADDAAAKDNDVVGVLPTRSMDLAWHSELHAGQTEGHRNSLETARHHAFKHASKYSRARPAHQRRLTSQHNHHVLDHVAAHPKY